jgi:hypothetical protein
MVMSKSSPETAGAELRPDLRLAGRGLKPHYATKAERRKYARHGFKEVHCLS